jgi:hypothetical protein
VFLRARQKCKARKPADVYIPLWNYGKAIAIDICGASSVDFSINVEEPVIKCNEQKELQVFREMQ